MMASSMLTAQPTVVLPPMVLQQAKELSHDASGQAATSVVRWIGWDLQRLAAPLQAGPRPQPASSARLFGIECLGTGLGWCHVGTATTLGVGIPKRVPTELPGVHAVAALGAASGSPTRLAPVQGPLGSADLTAHPLPASLLSLP